MLGFSVASPGLSLLSTSTSRAHFLVEGQVVKGLVPLLSRILPQKIGGHLTRQYALSALKHLHTAYYTPISKGEGRLHLLAS